MKPIQFIISLIMALWVLASLPTSRAELDFRPYRKLGGGNSRSQGSNSRDGHNSNDGDSSNSGEGDNSNSSNSSGDNSDSSNSSGSGDGENSNDNSSSTDSHSSSGEEDNSISGDSSGSGDGDSPHSNHSSNDVSVDTSDSNDSSVDEDSSTDGDEPEDLDPEIPTENPEVTPAGVPPGTNGDPHFRTWRNDHFEYHGQCDMILAKDDKFANGLGLQVQIRTKLVRYWSYIKSVAILIGSDIMEVQGDQEAHKEASKYWFNLEYNGKLDTIGGFPVTSHVPTPFRSSFTIDLSPKFPGQAIKISTYKEFVRVDFEQPTKEAYGNVVGLLGEFSTGKTLARDSTTVLNDFFELGHEWQVLPIEPMLFHDVAYPHFPQA